jgi:hypothetical protein
MRSNEAFLIEDSDKPIIFTTSKVLKEQIGSGLQVDVALVDAVKNQLQRGMIPQIM